MSRLIFMPKDLSPAGRLMWAEAEFKAGRLTRGEFTELLSAPTPAPPAQEETNMSDRCNRHDSALVAGICYACAGGSAPNSITVRGQVPVKSAMARADEAFKERLESSGPPGPLADYVPFSERPAFTPEEMHAANARAEKAEAELAKERDGRWAFASLRDKIGDRDHEISQLRAKVGELQMRCERAERKR